MNPYTLFKYTDHSDKSTGSGFVFLTYKLIDGTIRITASFDLEVEPKYFFRQDGLMKMTGSMEDILKFYKII